MKKTGLLLKGIGGFYYVLDASGDIVTCRARGKFRIDGLTPTVGDRVEFELQHTGDASLVSILPRRNMLLRPSVANIDRLFIVLSAGIPHPDFLLADRLIVMAKCNSIEPVPVLNKADAADEATAAAFDRDYGASFLTIRTSTRTGEGIDRLNDAICGNVCCFAGQSAVGKSSLLNRLIPALSLETGDLSVKTERGKHTTRHAELFPYAGGALLDTPGFSFLESEPLEQSALDACYPEFGDAPTRCRFAGCSHIKEKECAVKELVESGRLSQARYERYCLLAEECIARRKHRYD